MKHRDEIISAAEELLEKLKTSKEPLRQIAIEALLSMYTLGYSAALYDVTDLCEGHAK